MAPAAYDLTTVAAARLWGNIPNSVTDAAVQSLVSAWSQMFMTLTRRGMDLISGQAIVEQRDGTGTDSITTNHYPVIPPLTSLKIGLRDVPLAVYPSFGYNLDSGNQGFITLSGMIFTRGRGNVQISYPYGYPSIPTDVSEAANEMVLWLLRIRDHVDVDMQTLAAQITKYKTEFPITVCTAIAFYTRHRRTNRS